MAAALIGSAVLFAALACAHVAGYDYVKGRSAGRLPQFAMAMGAVRMVSALVFFAVAGAGQGKWFALAFVAMYFASTAIAIAIRH